MARVLKTGGKLVVIDMEAAEEALRNTENASMQPKSVFLIALPHH